MTTADLSHLAFAPYSPEALSPEDMADQVSISNEIVAELAAEEQVARDSGSLPPAGGDR